MSAALLRRKTLFKKTGLVTMLKLSSYKKCINRWLLSREGYPEVSDFLFLKASVPFVLCDTVRAVLSVPCSISISVVENDRTLKLKKCSYFLIIFWRYFKPLLSFLRDLQRSLLQCFFLSIFTNVSAGTSGKGKGITWKL